MHAHSIEHWRHRHAFLGARHDRHERRTWFVVALTTSLGLYYLLARPLGALAGAALDFTVKRNWAFARTAKGGLGREGIRYLLVSATSLVWQVVVCYLLVEIGGMRVGSAVVVGSLLVGVCWNYPLHRLFVFSVSPRAER